MCDRIEVLADILGGEVGTPQKLERERLDCEMGQCAPRPRRCVPKCRDCALRSRAKRQTAAPTSPLSTEGAAMSPDDGLFEASQNIYRALLARDDQDIVKVSMGLGGGSLDHQK